MNRDSLDTQNNFIRITFRTNQRMMPHVDNISVALQNILRGVYITIMNRVAIFTESLSYLKIYP